MAVGTSSVTINGVTYAFAGQVPNGTVSIGSAGKERTLTNLAAGRLDATSTDAVNGSQLNATNLAVEATNVKVNTLGGDVATALGGGASYDGNVFTMPSYNVYGSQYNNAGAAIAALQNLAPLQYSTAAAPTTGLGANGAPVSNDVTLVGPLAGAVTLHNVATGIDGTDAVNVDQLNNAISAAVINVGPTGAVYVAGNPDTYAMPSATGANATAVGSGSVASGQGSTAIGNGASATADNSVALGANSVANEANTVSVGAAGSERRVTNVAPGVNGTDAVNKNQLNAGLGQVQNQVNDNLKKSYGGTAAAIAIAGLRYDDRPGKISAGVATGWYHNQMGLAIGVGGTSDDGVWRVNGGLTMSPTLSSPDIGGVVGVTYTFN
uniref:YadA family autotransporter adhesin n=1 Tax=Caballeronia temeraria TaxID=1777137 RepID=UPI001FC94693|nr:YadA-like family protein [Caballeronia temeraria]